MSKHPNSWKAYNVNKDDFGRMQDFVWNVLSQVGPATGAELTFYMMELDMLSDKQKIQGVNSVRPRLNDLKKDGLVKVHENRECNITENDAEVLKAVGGLSNDEEKLDAGSEDDSE